MQVCHVCLQRLDVLVELGSYSMMTAAAWKLTEAKDAWSLRILRRVSDAA